MDAFLYAKGKVYYILGCLQQLGRQVGRQGGSSRESYFILSIFSSENCVDVYSRL